MKPTSIVSIVIAVILIIAGLVICNVASKKAEANGENLFEASFKTKEGRHVDITGLETKTIELKFDRAEVNILASEDESMYVDFINFNTNYYALTSPSSKLSFNEKASIKSVLNFWENGFDFRGMRYFVNRDFFKKDNGEEKTINIHIPESYSLTEINIESNECTLNISNVFLTAAVEITSKEATVSAESSMIESLSIGSKEAIGKKFTISSKKCLFGKINLYADNIYLDILEADRLDSLVLNSRNGKINLDIPDDISINADTSGSFEYNGRMTAAPFTHTPDDPFGSVELKCTNNPISITTYTVSRLQPEDTEAETSETSDNVSGTTDENN